MPEQIKQFLTSDTVYARLVGYDVNMGDIGGIDIGRGQSPHMHDISLSTEIALGFVRIPWEDQKFEWSMSGVNIVIDLSNAKVIVGSYYRQILQDGSVTAKQEEAETDSLTRGSQLEGDVDVGFGLKAYLPWVDAKARAKFNADRKNRRGKTSESKTNVTPVIAFVERTGDRVLRAGDKMGDRRRTQTRDLRGPIVVPYQSANSARDDEIPTPLVRIEALDSSKPVFGMITVRVEREDFVLDASKEHEIVTAALVEALERGKATMLRRKLEAEQDLRRRVAALAASKTNRPGGMQFDLFSCTFCIEPLSNDRSDERD